MHGSQYIQYATTLVLGLLENFNHKFQATMH